MEIKLDKVEHSLTFVTSGLANIMKEEKDDAGVPEAKPGDSDNAGGISITKFAQSTPLEAAGLIPGTSVPNILYSVPLL